MWVQPLRRKTWHQTWPSIANGVPQNSVLGKYHGITMKNPTEVMGGGKAMLLKILTQLGRFLHLAEAVLDNLQGKSKADLPFSKPETGISHTRKEQPTAPHSQSWVERSQVRFIHSHSSIKCNTQGLSRR
jgi:hypothetical protein